MFFSEQKINKKKTLGGKSDKRQTFPGTRYSKTFFFILVVSLVMRRNNLHACTWLHKWKKGQSKSKRITNLFCCWPNFILWTETKIFWRISLRQFKVFSLHYFLEVLLRQHLLEFDIFIFIDIVHIIDQQGSSKVPSKS